jgi:membrane-associated protease RseP (regulator of RpoE activity)
MKTCIIAILGITLAGACAGAAETQTSPRKIEIEAPAKKGKATIIIEIDGRKEVREIEIGDASKITIEEGTKAAPGTASTPVKAARRTWIGVAVDEPGPELRAQLPIAEGTGLLVRRVFPESPAHSAGLKENDVLVKLDDQLLTNAAQFIALVAARAEGATVRLTYLRKGAETVANITLGSRENGDADAGGTRIPNLLGLLAEPPGANKEKLRDVLRNLTAPLTIRMEPLVVDPGGSVAGGGAGVPLGIPNVSEALKDSGLSDEQAREVQRKLEETSAAIQKAVGDLSLKKEDIVREVEKAMQEAQKAIQAARAAAEAVEREYSKPAADGAGEGEPKDP